MSWLPDGRFISDQTQNGNNIESGADIPTLGHILNDVHKQEK